MKKYLLIMGLVCFAISQISCSLFFPDIESEIAKIPEVKLVEYNWNTPTTGFYQIQGMVKNYGNGIASYTKIYWRFRDTTGNIAGSDYCYADMTEISAGATSGFDFTGYSKETYNTCQIYQISCLDSKGNIVNTYKE